jgi:hypothetical protein
MKLRKIGPEDMGKLLVKGLIAVCAIFIMISSVLVVGVPFFLASVAVVWAYIFGIPRAWNAYVDWRGRS